MDIENVTLRGLACGVVERRRTAGMLKSSLAEGEDDGWASWEWIPRYKDWDPLVPELHE